MNFVLNSFSMSRELQENLVNVDLTEPKDQGAHAETQEGLGYLGLQENGDRQEEQERQDHSVHLAQG